LARGWTEKERKGKEKKRKNNQKLQEPKSQSKSRLVQSRNLEGGEKKKNFLSFTKDIPFSKFERKKVSFYFL